MFTCTSCAPLSLWWMAIDGVIVKLGQAQAAIQEKSQAASRGIVELVAADQRVSPPAKRIQRMT